MKKEQFLSLLPTDVRIVGDHKTRRVTVNGAQLSPVFSQSIRNHSPDGFAWGYGGSGPAQFALALLLKWVPVEAAQMHYQDLKFGYIAGLPQNDFNVRINLRAVMAHIMEAGPFEAVKSDPRQFSAGF